LIDGPSLLRASQISPNNPWSVFEPENFQKFLQTRDKYIWKFLNNISSDFAYINGIFGNDKSKQNASQYATMMIREFIPSLINDFGGSYPKSISIFNSLILVSF
jgi:hypothetical protein